MLCQLCCKAVGRVFFVLGFLLLLGTFISLLVAYVNGKSRQQSFTQEIAPLVNQTEAWLGQYTSPTFVDYTTSLLTSERAGIVCSGLATFFFVLSCIF